MGIHSPPETPKNVRHQSAFHEFSMQRSKSNLDRDRLIAHERSRSAQYSAERQSSTLNRQDYKHRKQPSARKDVPPTTEVLTIKPLSLGSSGNSNQSTPSNNSTQYIRQYSVYRESKSEIV